MAKKKEPSIQDSIDMFKDIINRIGVETITHENRILLVKTNKNSTIMITPDQTLWNALSEDKDFIEKVNPIDVNDKFALSIIGLANNDNWIDINSDEFQSGKIINVSVEGYEYSIPICKDSLPLKLKKAEVSDIAYQISTITMPTITNKVLMLRKYFEGCVPDTSFSIISLFIIV